jgi:hypothetical protein
MRSALVLQLAVSLGPATLGDGGEFMLVDDRPGKRKRVRDPDRRR